MPSKPKFFLLDAGPVIELNKLGLWPEVIERAEIWLPSIVARTEVGFWADRDGERHAINLEPDLQAGRFRIAEGDTAAHLDVLRKLDSQIRERVHDGELEAIAVLAAWKEGPRPAFCCADKMAVVVLCLLGLSETPIALESLLQRIGLSQPLEDKYREDTMRRWVDDGCRRFAQGDGLA